MLKTMIGLAAAVSLLGGVAMAAPVTYTDRTSFEAVLLTSDTDDFSRSTYSAGDNGATPNFERYTDAGMSAVRGQTKFQSTGFQDLNFVGQLFNTYQDDAYCSGCNGSFILDFTSTSFGTSSGVGGVGLDVVANRGSSSSAFVTFGDGSMQTFALGVSLGVSFFGLTSDQLISSIHFTTAGGQPQRTSTLVIDNLTIGSTAPIAPVPLPAGLPLVLTGFGALVWARRRRRG